MLLVSDTGADNINDEHFSVAGVFDLPNDLADVLIRFPGWRAPTAVEAQEHSDATAATKERVRRKPGPKPAA
jgi:hypothetical protein